MTTGTQTTISFKITNNCKYFAGYVAIGTDAFTRVAPPDGSIYTGSLGTYNVVWTATKGNPGFPSIKFVPTFNDFNNGAMEVFMIVVSNFDPNTIIQVQAHAGPATDTFSFLLSTPCPTSAPTLATQPLGGFTEWSSSSWNRSLNWIAPQATTTAIGPVRSSYFTPDFAPPDDYLPALSRDGTLNWSWVKETSKQNSDESGR